jgi:hypothetical protein
MRRKFTATAIALLAVASAAVFTLASPATAQTGSGIGPCAVLAGTQNVGTVSIGQRFVIQLAPQCVFTAGAAVTVTVNGVNIPGKVANASGFVLVDITVLSATQLSVSDPTITPAVCGVNTVTARGPSTVANGQIVTQTATFTLNCPGATTGAATTGAATANTGRLSLTGANITRWLLAALALLAVGSLLVLADRRRHRGRNDGLAG